jgi:carbon storage regulator
MLILSRRESESVHLGDDIVLTIVRVSGEKVRIGIQAPPHIKVLRNELEIEPKNSASDGLIVIEPTNVQESRTAQPPLRVRRSA